MADEVDIAPVERDEFAAAESGVGGDADELGVLDVLASPDFDLALAERRTRWVSVSADSE